MEHVIEIKIADRWRVVADVDGSANVFASVWEAVDAMCRWYPNKLLADDGTREIIRAVQYEGASAVGAVYAYDEGAGELTECAKELLRGAPRGSVLFDGPRKRPHWTEHVGSSFQRGVNDAYEDDREGEPCKSIGLQGRATSWEMCPPEYVSPEDGPGYMRGYSAAAEELYGKGWQRRVFELRGSAS